MRCGSRLPRRRSWRRSCAPPSTCRPENVIDQATVKAFSLKIFERTFAVTAALNVLTLGVAALAIFASLLTLSGMRLPQLAPVWAMGLTRRRLALLEILRSAALAAFTMLAAVPLGLALAWCCSRWSMSRPSAGGCRCMSSRSTGCGCSCSPLASAMLAALLPALWLTRRQPADLAEGVRQ